MKASQNKFNLLKYIPYRFNVIIQRSALLLAAQYKYLGITRAQFHVIAFVATYPGISPKKIIELTIMDKNRVTRAIDGLVKKQLLLRRINSEDKRVALLNLTVKGKELYQELDALAFTMQYRFSTSLTEEEQKVLDKVLIKMDGALNQLEAEFSKSNED